MTSTFDLDRIGAGLPVADARAELDAALASGAMVVTAPPGTGKTTVVPPLVAAQTAGRTILTQPRRVAVRAAARRIAELDGSAIGERVGFTVRGEHRAGPDTRLEVVTPGVLLRRLLADPELPGVGAVVLDEVHERSIDTDLLLGMLAEVRALREDLRLVAMSATLDAEALAALLGGAASAPVVEIPAPLHELSIEWAPPRGLRLDARGVTPAFLDHLARETVRAHAHGGSGAAAADTLVFVPGVREVEESVRRLRALTSTDAGASGTLAEVLPLHGRLSAREQDRVTGGRAAGDPPRIIVSTALAESSLTVPGVRTVVDAGLSREVRRDRGRDMSGLVTVSASRASIDQRAGRAARQGPGRAVRLFSQTDAARMPALSLPEIAVSDLVDTALLLACWGTPRGEGLDLLTPPPDAAIADAEQTLRTLDLVDGEGRATDLGRRVARMPVGAREGRALILAGADAQLAAEVVAAVSDDHRSAGADLTGLLAELRSGRHPGSRRWQGEVRRLARIARDSAEGPMPSGPEGAMPAARDGERSAGEILALGRPDRIARRVQEGSRSYLLASGTRAAVPEGSALAGPAWLAVWEVQRAPGRAADGTGAVIRLAAPLDEETALRVGAGQVSTERTARIIDGRPSARLVRRLGAIPLSSTPVPAEPGDLARALAAQVDEQGLAALPWTDAASDLRRRLALIHRELGDPWPAMDDASLLARRDQWLDPQIAALAAGSGRRRTDLGRLDLVAALRSLLPWPEASRLDELAPERLTVPSGSSVRIRYPDVPSSRAENAAADGSDAADPSTDPSMPSTEDQVTVAVKLQEVFGLARTPRLVDGRVPVTFHLLSPARRPLAVTADLRSFWDGPYQQVRREMRGRYPKHPWPEDPWSAPATARTTARSVAPAPGGGTRGAS